MLDKSLRRNIKKRREKEIRKRKLGEMGTLDMRQKKWNKLDKSKRSSYSPVVFKHGCSLETYLEFWRKPLNRSFSSENACRTERWEQQRCIMIWIRGRRGRRSLVELLIFFASKPYRSKYWISWRYFISATCGCLYVVKIVKINHSRTKCTWYATRQNLISSMFIPW